jgi:AraC family transcriptional activator of pobA
MTGKKTLYRAVPVYHLYGEQGWESAPDLVHCESIASRSRLHNWEIHPHRHYGLFQILWLARGMASVELDGRRDTLAAGQVLLVPQHCVHGFQFSPEADGEVITLSYVFFERLQSSLGTVLQQMSAPAVCTLALSEDRQQIETAFHAMHQAYVGHDPHCDLLMEAQLVSLLVWLCRLLPDQDEAMPLARGRAHLRRFSQWIEAEFIHQRPLDYYADKLGISVAHLNALCRQLTNYSALALIHARLGLEARRHLIYTSMPVKDISDALGFSDPAYFTRFFKRQAGISPAAFRASARPA